MIEDFLEEAVSNGITNVADLLEAIKDGTCDSWPSFRGYLRLEAAGIRASSIKSVLGRRK